MSAPRESRRPAGRSRPDEAPRRPLLLTASLATPCGRRTGAAALSGSRRRTLVRLRDRGGQGVTQAGRRGQFTGHDKYVLVDRPASSRHHRHGLDAPRPGPRPGRMLALDAALVGCGHVDASLRVQSNVGGPQGKNYMINVDALQPIRSTRRSTTAARSAASRAPTATPRETRTSPRGSSSTPARRRGEFRNGENCPTTPDHGCEVVSECTDFPAFSTCRRGSSPRGRSRPGSAPATRER